MATLKDIARKTGVSTETVSRVLNGKYKGQHPKGQKRIAQIMKISRQLNYRPNFAAKQLVGKSSCTIGVIANADDPLAHFARISLLDKEAQKHNLRVLIAQSHPELNTIQACIDDFISRSVEGIVMMAHNYPGLNNDVMKICRDVDNIVFYGMPEQIDDSTCFVDVDRADGIKQVVDYFVSNGKRRISYFDPKFISSKFPNKFKTILERERGYVTAMKNHDLPLNKNFADRFVLQEQEMSRATVLSLIKLLIEQDNPDAIIARDDVTAALIIKSLITLKISVPKQISVIGFDNLDFCEYTTPTLSSIDPMPEQLSKMAVEIILDQKGAKKMTKREKQVLLTPKLCIRESA